MRRSMARALGVLGLLVPVVGSAEVFINEIHYDNAGSPDTGEAVEVVATAGEDLGGYSIVLYNGNGGGTYDNDPVPIGSAVACGADVRLGVVSYAGGDGDQIQNGNPDGIALVGPGDLVLQFLSYEGSFTATDGPAVGMASTDIGVFETNDMPAGLSLQLSGNGTSAQDFTWQAAGSATFGACNTGQTFGTPVDNPPYLLASVPTDQGALPANASLSLTFSEPVAVALDAIGLICAPGAITGVELDITGGPTSFTLTPQAPLVVNDSCVLALDAAGITDQDGTADPLDPPYELAFVVEPPVANAPPEVLSTVPANGASGFPVAGDLGVTFSEPVTLAAGAFALDCVASTGIVLDHPASGTAISIGTGTALVFEDACTFTIDAAAITDAEGATLVPVAPVAFTVAGNAAGSYYDQVNTSSPEQLRCSLHEIINDHTVYPYSGSGTNAWTILELAEEHPGDSTKIIDGYRNRVYTKGSDRAGTGSGITYNREHSWPNSLGFGSSGLVPYSDTHMLYLTDTGYNSDRGNVPYANCPQSSGCSEDPTEFNNGRGGGSGTYPGNSNWYKGSGNTGSFEVWNARKGDFARTVLYMAIRYEGGDNVPDLELTDDRSLIVGTSSSASTAYMGLLTTVLQWHMFDPPDAAERERNDVVYSFQGNRNPFIDHPEWATLGLFQSAQPATCIMGTANSAPVAVDDAYDAIEDMVFSVDLLDGVLDNDTDADSDALTAELVADATHGQVQLAADGGFAYTPAPDYCGADQFTYRASDGQALSAVAIVQLAVACSNDAPVAVGTLAHRAGQVGVAIAPFSVAGGFADADTGDDLAFSASGLPAGLALDPVTGQVEGTPAAGADAGSPYAVTVTASDGEADAQQVFTFAIEAAPPEALFRDGFED